MNKVTASYWHIPFALRGAALRPRSQRSSHWRKFQPAAALILIAFAAPSLPAQVRFNVGADQVAIQINGKPFSVLHFGKKENKPFLHPLLTPAGENVLRGFPVSPLPGDSTDRPHQRGMWIGSEGVNGPAGIDDFWENDPAYDPTHKAVIAFQKLLETKNGDDKGRIALEANWIGSDKKLWLIERRTMTFYSKPADCRMFDIDIDLEAKEEITFLDIQDAILGVRLALPFDQSYDGRFLNDKNDSSEATVRGHRSAWIDWTAELGPKEYKTSPHGHAEKVGFAIFDHPSNLNYPARWQLRSFGNMSVNPFAGKTTFEMVDETAQKANDHTMKPGDKLHLRYRVLIHPAATSIEPFFKEWASQK